MADDLTWLDEALTPGASEPARICVICELSGPRPTERKQRLNWRLLHWAWFGRADYSPGTPDWTALDDTILDRPQSG